MTKRRVHFVLSTHWDREWRTNFQELRYDLVRLMDSVLAGLEDGRLLGPFTTDGQSIVVEDYLEIRPERREQIERLAGEGKLSIGPWYVMPDVFLVSGESLIRNLRYGRELARQFGGQPSAAGYVCDMFGHNSQLPQIFAGFGVTGALVWRGLNLLDRRNLIWRGADGTQMPTYRFGNHGYGRYAFVVRRGHEFEAAHDPDAFPTLLADYLREEAQATDVDPILMLDGCDHQFWDQTAYSLLQKEMARPDSPYEFVHTDFDGFLAEMTAQTERIETQVEGELREPGRQSRQSNDDFLLVDHQWLIPGVLSSRPWIKQANRACETLLCQWAEPFSAWAHAALGEEYPQGFLDAAWKWLLQNHPHDSMGGCSIDQVHRDMVYRFDQARQIAGTLTQRATRHLAASIEGEVGPGEVRVVVFNPLPRPHEQVTELSLQLPPDWPAFQEFFGFELKPGFLLFDADGTELPYQRLAQSMNRIKSRIRDTKFPEGYRTHDVTVAVPLSIPALGYTTLTLRAGKPGQPSRYPDTPGLATSECSMANETLSVEIEPNGTLVLTDLRSGVVYRRLLTFEDRADIGDGWFHGMAVNDRAIVSTTARSELSLVHNGPLLTTFRIRTWLTVPEAFDFARMERSERSAEMVIDSSISLRRGQPYLDIETTVTNQVNDHRLRVLFPSGAQAATYLADSQYDVVERPIALRADNHLYRELEVETKPQQSWTAVFDGQRGLAIVAEGLLETAVRDLPERPIALTLFRATGRTALTDGEPDGQVHGTLRFRYFVVPISGAPDRAGLCELGQHISAGVRTVHMQSQDILMDRMPTALPRSASFLQVEGPAVVTSIRRIGTGLEVRLYNPAAESIKASLIGPALGPSGSQQLVDFESNALADREPWTGQAEIVLSPKQIVTLRLT